MFKGTLWNFCNVLEAGCSYMLVDETLENIIKVTSFWGVAENLRSSQRNPQSNSINNFNKSSTGLYWQTRETGKIKLCMSHCNLLTDGQLKSD